MRIRFILMIAAGIPAAIALVSWLSTVMIARSRHKVDRCPMCKSDRVRPSWPKIIDKLMNVASIAAFRCEACLERFYARKPLAGKMTRIPI